MKSKYKKVYFVVLTTYQLFISDAYARYINEKYSDTDIILFTVGLNTRQFNTEGRYQIVSVPDLNRSKGRRIWQRLYWSGRLFACSPLAEYFKHLSECHLFVFNDNEPISNKLMRITHKGRHNSISIIEEGIGIYEITQLSGRKLNARQLFRYAVTWILGSPMQYKAVGENKMIKNAVVSDVELFCKLDKAKGKTVLFQDKRALYRRADGFLARNNLRCDGYEEYETLYLGQPLNETGTMSSGEEDYILFLLKDIGKVLIKPHPREQMDKYDELVQKNSNIKILDGDIALLPLECLLSVLHVKILISFNSSAGVNLAKANPDITSIFTYDMPESRKFLEQWNNGYAEMNRNLFQRADHNLMVPSSYHEYLDFIINTKSHSGQQGDGHAETKSTLEEIDHIMNQ